MSATCAACPGVGATNTAANATPFRRTMWTFLSSSEVVGRTPAALAGVDSIGDIIMAEAQVQLGFTQNLGNYESIRVTIQQGRDGFPDADLDEVTNELYKAVEQQLIEKARGIYESLTKGTQKNTNINPG
jgi:hypothetical protein